MEGEAITEAERETLERLLKEGERLVAVPGFAFKRTLDEEENRLMRLYLMDPTIAGA